MTGIQYQVDPPLQNQELNELFEASWPHREDCDFQPVLRQSLTCVAAYAGTRLVGFVYVAWDGEQHGFVLDTTVHPEFRRQGIGLRLLELATEQAAARGLEWLHVDFEPAHESFYRTAGFVDTCAGLRRLRPRSSTEPVVAPEQGPTLLFLLGPPAVGKMTVGAELERRTGLRLFHNHQTIDVVLPYFPFGTPAFNRLVGSFRRGIFQEVAASDLPGLIFTYVWAFNEPAEDAAVERLANIFRARGGKVYFVELSATQAERLRRNETPIRLAAKPFKRDLPQSRQHLLELDARYQLNSGNRFSGRADYLYIDNTALSPEEVADRIMVRFPLPRPRSLDVP
jgi:GNAT superfamily N-acetyltransferase